MVHLEILILIPTAYRAFFINATPNPCLVVPIGDDNEVQLIVCKSIASTVFRVFNPSRPPVKIQQFFSFIYQTIKIVFELLTHNNQFISIQSTTEL